MLIFSIIVSFYEESELALYFILIGVGLAVSARAFIRHVDVPDTVKKIIIMCEMTSALFVIFSPEIAILAVIIVDTVWCLVRERGELTTIGDAISLAARISFLVIIDDPVMAGMYFVFVLYNTARLIIVGSTLAEPLVVINALGIVPCLIKAGSMEKKEVELVEV